jgi:tetratricopeptide (TPR) repeat protein
MYQWHVAWQGCITALLDHALLKQNPVVAVGIEVDGAGNLDDVVLYRTRAPHSYLQVKYAVDATKLINSEYLLAPTRSGGPSILEKIATAWRRLAAHGNKVDLALVTTRAIDPQDPLLSKCDTRTSLVMPHAETGSPQSSRGKQRASWAAATGLTEAELLSMLSVLRFDTALTPLRIRDVLTSQLRNLGLPDDDEALALGADWIARNVRDGRKYLELDEINEAVTTLWPHWYVAQPMDLRSFYVADIESIAPSSLLGREKELAEVNRFIASSENYLWWRADPWAGKTALASWLALNPPHQVNVAAFYITQRLSAQSDSNAYLTTISEQLAYIANRQSYSSDGSIGRRGVYRRLLTEAAAASARTGKKLLLIVDGLDEDLGVRPGVGFESIASLLPSARDLSSQIKIIITSRHHPGLPDDVPTEHPIRRATVRHLSPSSLAKDIKKAAITELRDALRGGDLQADIIGFIAGANSGLTLPDLAELTGRPRYQVRDALENTIARSLRTRRILHMATTRDILVLAHQALQEIALHELSDIMPSYYSRLSEWAERGIEKGWNDASSEFSLFGYSKLLQTQVEKDFKEHAASLRRLVKLVADTSRGDLLARRTGGDDHALQEILSAMELILHVSGEPEQYLADLVCLAGRRDLIRGRNVLVPPLLPSLYAQLGDVGRALSMVRSLRSENGNLPLRRLASVLVHKGQTDQAIDLIQSTEGAATRAEGFGSVIAALVNVGKIDDATRLAARAQLESKNDVPMARLAEALANQGYTRQSRNAESRIENNYLRARVRISRAAALAHEGRHEQAEVIARKLSGTQRAEAYLGILKHCDRRTLDFERTALKVVEILNDAGARARGSKSERRGRDEVLIDLACLCAQQGELDRAIDFAHQITGISPKASALEALALMIESGAPSTAAALRSEVQGLRQSLARTSPNGERQLSMRLARIMARAGAVNEALEEAAKAKHSSAQATILVDVAFSIALSDPKKAMRLALQAERLTRRDSEALSLASADIANAISGAYGASAALKYFETVENSSGEFEHVSMRASLLAKAGRAAEAIRLLDQVMPPIKRAVIYGRMVVAVAADDRASAEGLAREVVELATSIEPVKSRTYALNAIRAALLRAGLDELIVDLDVHLATLTQAPLPKRSISVRDYVLAGNLDQALAHVNAMGDLSLRATSLVIILRSCAASEPSLAKRLFADIENIMLAEQSQESRQRAMSALAIARSIMGDMVNAVQLAFRLRQSKYFSATVRGVASSMIEQSQWEAFSAFAGRLGKLSGEHVSLLADLACELALLGQVERAEALIHMIADPGQKAAAWSRLAQALASSDIRKSRYCIATALHLGPLGKSTEALAAVAAKDLVDGLIWADILAKPVKG